MNNNYDDRIDYACFILPGASLLFLLIRQFVPSFVMDKYTIYLLLIALTPWIAPWIKTVELPGGIKADFNSMRETAKEAGILQEAEGTDFSSKAKSLISSGSETKGELAKMWVGLADNVSNLAVLHSIPQQKDIKLVIDSLGKEKLINEKQQALLLNIADIFNGVLKGKRIDSRIAELALKVGPQLSATLKNLSTPAGPAGSMDAATLAEQNCSKQTGTATS